MRRSLRYENFVIVAFLLLPEFGPFLNDEVVKETDSVFGNVSGLLQTLDSTYNSKIYKVSPLPL